MNAPQETAPPARRTLNAEALVLLVLLIGIVVGFALSFNSALVPPSNPACPPAPPPPAPAPPCPTAPTPSTGFGYAQLEVVFSVLAVALVIALLGVYLRTYRETRAPYIVGLLLFLVALLIEIVLTSPFVFVALDVAPGKLAPYQTFGQFFMDAALAIFLYLSLQ